MKTKLILNLIFLLVKEVKRIFWYLFIATKGGFTRIKIIKELLNEPMNANKLAEKLKIDYKTVRHHLEILVQNKFLIKEGNKYSVVYFPSYFLESNKDLFEEICRKYYKR